MTKLEEMNADEIKKEIISFACCGDHAQYTKELLEAFEKLIRDDTNDQS
jgi:hypothetical protein